MKMKRAGARTGPFLKARLMVAAYPFVTTGGGALPLPVLAQPAMLSRASTAAVASASFFMKKPSLLSRQNNDIRSAPYPLVQRSHSAFVS
jgi:hypothetical protein